LRYRIEYSQEAVDHLEVFTARDQAIIVDAVDRQLANEPLKETGNRKPMRPNPITPWELRIGTFRVYQPALFMTVRREIAQSRCETGMRSREAPRRT